jgi:hypothetical protein
MEKLKRPDLIAAKTDKTPIKISVKIVSFGILLPQYLHKPFK